MRQGPEPTRELDALIIGAGICGLWALAHLHALGHACLLVEREAMGSGQTIASQGIIHGGTKYALDGQAREASRMIAQMPGRWRESMQGLRAPDLSPVRVLSESCCLWTAPGIASRITGLAASRAIRVRPTRLSRNEAPPPFANAPKSVDCYRLDEPVLDPASLVQALASPLSDRIALGTYAPDDDGSAGGSIATADMRLPVRARHIIICAGAGGESLTSSLVDAPRLPLMQRRPLHMVMARRASERGEALPLIFAHGVGVSSSPRLTITSQTDSAGRVVWWIGGQVAERGVDLDPPALIAHARDELRAMLGWLDLDGVEFATWRVDRAESLTPGGGRPDGPVVESRDRESGQRVHCCWPTKLAFAPAIADALSERLGEPVTSADDARATTLPEGWPRPKPATLPWETPGVQWS